MNAGDLAFYVYKQINTTIHFQKFSIHTSGHIGENNPSLALGIITLL